MGMRLSSWWLDLGLKRTHCEGGWDTSWGCHRAAEAIQEGEMEEQGKKQVKSHFTDKSASRKRALEEYLMT